MRPWIQLEPFRRPSVRIKTTKRAGWDGSARKGTCHQPWPPEFKPWHLREENWYSKLSSDLHMCTDKQHTHTHTIILKVQRWLEVQLHDRAINLHAQVMGLMASVKTNKVTELSPQFTGVMPSAQDWLNDGRGHAISHFFSLSSVQCTLDFMWHPVPPTQIGSWSSLMVGCLLATTSWKVLFNITKVSMKRTKCAGSSRATCEIYNPCHSEHYALWPGAYHIRELGWFLST